MNITKELAKKRLLLGIGIAIVGYFGFKYVISKFTKPKIAGGNVNFIGANGDSTELVAKRYDANYVNKDGSKGATWISYNDSDVIGYWEKGKIQEGEPIHTLI